jgi:RNA polymerase sigma factor (TIGR02999 family)
MPAATRSRCAKIGGDRGDLWDGRHFTFGAGGTGKARRCRGFSAALIDTVYPELRRLARRYLAGERPNHTLQASDLVHEAWVRLFSAAEISVHDRAHLVALMATQMRRALVDYARHRNAAKGPGAAIRVSLGSNIIGIRLDEDVIALDEALTALEAVEPRAVRIVEMRFFGGFEEMEAAEAVGVSVSTVKRDWAFARAWLFDRLKGAE